MKKFFLIVLCILLLSGSAYGQEILSVDNSRSYVLNLDDGGKKYLLEDFDIPRSEQLLFLEGQKLEAHIFIMRDPSSNPRNTYVLEMRTELRNAEWQYKIFGETKVISSVKSTVWNSSRDHSASSFEIVLSGEVPKPVIRTEEPHFTGYTGEGPGFRNSELAIFTIYDGQVTKVQDVGEYTFLSTNPDINSYKEIIKKNLDVSGLDPDHVDALEEQRENILRLSENGHVGLALDLSESFAGMAARFKSMPDDNANILLILVIGGILLAVMTGVIGYKAGQGGGNVSPELINQMERSLNTLKQNAEKLEKIDISSIPGAEVQAMELEKIKRQVSPSIAGLKNILNRLR